MVIEMFRIITSIQLERSCNPGDHPMNMVVLTWRSTDHIYKEGMFVNK